MKRTSLLILLALAGKSAGAAVTVAGPERELRAVADRMHSTVIEIEARPVLTVVMESGQESLRLPSFATGVLVGDGLAITTLHGIGGMVSGKFAAWGDLQAVVPDLGTVPARVVGWFPEWDLAVLEVPESASLATAPLATEAATRGEALIVMGIGDDAVTGVGVTVAGTSGDQLVLTSPRRIDSRYWGGPLFDAQGRLAGIALTSFFPRAIGAGTLAALLDKVRGR